MADFKNSTQIKKTIIKKAQATVFQSYKFKFAPKKVLEIKHGLRIIL